MTLALFADATPRATVRLGGADISPCGRYRYRLWREWNPSIPQRACFVMLNPSTADGAEDDPTIRRCVAFAIAWGYGALDVVNLFAHRATDPRELLRSAFADGMTGPDNDYAIERCANRAAVVVAAWGAHPYKHPSLAPRATAVASALRSIGALHSLRLTKDGHPSHPLYLPGDLKPAVWT